MKYILVHTVAYPDGKAYQVYKFDSETNAYECLNVKGFKNDPVYLPEARERLAHALAGAAS